MEKICRLKSHRLCVIIVDRLESRLNIMNLLIKEYDRSHRSANNEFVFVVGKRKIISGVIFDVESESKIRISLLRQDFEIFEVMCSKNGVFRYF